MQPRRDRDAAATRVRPLHTLEGPSIDRAARTSVGCLTARRAKHRLDPGNVVGYGLAISVAGNPAAVGQGGFAQIPLLDANVLFTHQTDIQVASVSKAITAIALLQLMEKLDISPDDQLGSAQRPESVGVHGAAGGVRQEPV